MSEPAASTPPTPTVSQVVPVQTAPSDSPSKPPPAPPSVPVVVQAIDRAGEIIFVLCLFWLTLRGKADILVFVGASFAVLGVQNSIRNVAAAKANATHVSGALGLAFAVAGSATLHRIIAGGSFLAVLGVMLAGCPALSPPDGCEPASQRCHSGRPQVCSQTQRWTELEQSTCESRGGVCCRTASVFTGRVVYACARPEQCLPEPEAPTDASTSDAADAAEASDR